MPWILIALALINALGWTFARWRFENSYTATQLTVDFADTRSLADSSRVSQLAFLKELRKRGVTSAVVSQQTVFSLRDLGRLAVTSREVAERIYPRADWKTVPPGYRYVLTFSRNAQSLQSQVFAHLKAQGVPDRPPRELDLGLRDSDLVPRGILVPASLQLLSATPVGFDAVQLGLLKRADMVPTARIANAANLTPARANRLLGEAHDIGARTVLFGEDEVMGYESLMPIVTKAARAHGLAYAIVEFTKQRGWEEFSAGSQGELVRVHTVNGDEAAKLTQEAMLDRFVRAVKERNIRIVYIIFPRQFKGEYEMPNSGLLSRLRGKSSDPNARPVLKKTALQQNLDLVSDISSDLQTPPVPFAPFLHPAMKMAPAVPFGEYPMPQLSAAFGRRGTTAATVLMWLGRFLSGLGVVGGVLLLLHLLFDLSARASRKWLWTGVAMAAACALSAGIGARLLGLAAGVPFGCIGILWGGLPEVWDKGQNGNGKVTLGEACRVGFATLVRTTALTCIGGFYIVSLLNSWVYLSKANKFLGTKLLLMAPIFVIGLVFAAEAFPHRVLQEGAAPARQRLLSRFRALTSRPFTIGIALGLLAVMAAGFLYIARAGNDSGMEVSPLELALRSTLEKVFITRPRTKEIFLCHPAMLFAVWFALRRQTLPALLCAALVGMGQADVVDTFCHIHTPLFFSLWRIIMGVLIGGALGSVALWLWSRIERQAQTRRPARSNGHADDMIHEHGAFDDALEQTRNGTGGVAAPV